MHFTSTVVALAIVTLANANVIGKRALSGEATYYGGNIAGGACSFSTYTLPANIYGTALSDSNWAGSANCGACVSVVGPAGNKITAMIVDECPGCGTNHLDLFPTAFSALASLTVGIIDVTWSYIDCPITTPLELHNKEGVSANWFSMQVVNSAKPVSTLEVSTDGGSTWQATTRQTYNFFQNSAGFGTTAVDVKVTSTDGSIVVVNNVAIISGASTTAASNFGGASSATGVASSVIAAAASPSVAASSPVEIAASSSTPVAVATSAIQETATTFSVAPKASTTTAASTKSATSITPTPKQTASAAPEKDACGENIEV